MVEGSCPLCLRLVTYNINGEDLSGDISSLFKTTDGDSPIDVYVFCFQEAIELSFTTVLQDLVSSRARDGRCRQLEASLEAAMDGSFVKVHSEELVGLFIVVYARDSLQSSLQYAQSAVVARGPVGLGNKGACAIRLKFNEMSVVCLNAHLAADEEEVEQRNADTAAIGKWLEFPAPPGSNYLEPSIHSITSSVLSTGHVRDLHAPNVSEDFTAAIDSGQASDGHWPSTIFDCDYLIFCGDLNYRLDLSHDAVLRAIDQHRYEFLMQHDQLRQEQLENKAFDGFHEHAITWRPSYKFDKSQDADRSYSKKRTPSYTDRILYRGCNDHEMEAVEYKLHEEIRLSDHLPVSATFHLYPVT